MKRLYKRPEGVARLAMPLDDEVLASVTGGCFSAMPRT